MDTPQYKCKSFSFDLKETTQVDRENGVRLGIIKGFLAVYNNIDRDNERIAAGAFAESLQSLRERNRSIRMKFQHLRDEPIGMFPINKIQDTPMGLFVEGEINLDVQRGQETFALAKQGALSDLSVGFMVLESERDDEAVLVFTKLDILEGSVVDEPANQEAVFVVKKLNFEDVKDINTKKDFKKILCQASFSQNAAKQLISKFCKQPDAASEQQPPKSIEQPNVVNEEGLPNNKAVLKALSEATAHINNL